MKIIKPGRQQTGWAIEATCTGAGNGGGGCGAVLLVEEGDLFHVAEADLGGSHDIFTTFRCQACGVLTDLNDVPGNVRVAATQEEWEKSRENR